MVFFISCAREAAKGAPDRQYITPTGHLALGSKKKNRVMKIEPGFRRKVEEKTDFRSSLKPGFF
jgi:hypothetical protein